MLLKLEPARDSNRQPSRVGADPNGLGPAFRNYARGPPENRDVPHFPHGGTLGRYPGYGDVPYFPHSGTECVPF